MHYYTHNIGEFATQTRFMPLEEIGIYAVLRDEYLLNGIPLVYDRITTMFSPEYEASVKRVLARCFVEKDGVFTCPAFDQMLNEYRSQAEKNRRNIQKRWEKVRQVNENGTTEYDSYTNGTNSNTNGTKSNTKTYLTNNQEPITNNQEPITNNQKKEEGSAFAPEPTHAQEVRKPTSSPSRGTQFGLDSMPDEWRDYAETTYPNLDSSKLFGEFSDYWKSIPGEKGRKKDWLATWRNHLRNLPTWKQELFAKQGAKTADKGLTFGNVSEKYAHVLGSKLAATQDPALSSISYGCQSWDDAAKVYARMLLSSEGSFETVKTYLVKHGIVRG